MSNFRLTQRRLVTELKLEEFCIINHFYFGTVISLYIPVLRIIHTEGWNSLIRNYGFMCSCTICND